MVGGLPGCDQPPPGPSAAAERGAEPAYTPKRTDLRTRLPAAGGPGDDAEGPKEPRESGEGVVTNGLEETVRAFFADWTTRDPDVLVSYFAPDAEWSEANRAPARGHKEIRSVLELQVGFGSGFEFEFS